MGLASFGVNVAPPPLRPRLVRCKAAADAACARCGGPLKVIGRVNTHRVEWAPGHFFIEREAWGQSPEAVLALR